jgi:hypothetical protein
MSFILSLPLLCVRTASEVLWESININGLMTHAAQLCEQPQEQLQPVRALRNTFFARLEYSTTEDTLGFKALIIENPVYRCIDAQFFFWVNGKRGSGYMVNCKRGS